MSGGENDEAQIAFSDKIQWMVHKGTRLGTDFIGNLRSISEDMGTGSCFDDISAYFASHPLIALFAIAMLVSCAVPIIIFLVFAAVTVLITFTTFLLIAGTILAISSVMLLGFILAMLLIMLSMTTVVGIAYYGYNEFFDAQEDLRQDTRE